MIKSAQMEGHTKGMEQGIEQTKKQTVINMLNDSIDINLISKYANISIEKISEIKNNLKN